MLDYHILHIDYGVSYGSVTLKSLQNDNVPELDLLVREAIQNSSDASLQEPGDRFRVNFNTGIFCPADLNSYITDLQSVLDQKFPGAEANFMEIRDINTSGLTGCIRKSEIADDDHGNFFKLIYDTGKRQTQQDAGGNWGFGKSVYYRVGVGIVIFYSRIKTETGYDSRLIVTLVEDESSPDALLRPLDSRSAGKAWWGIRDGEDLLPLTDRDAEFIKAVLDVFKLKPFKENETGTSIIIPYINPDVLLGDIIPNEADIREDVKQTFMSVWGKSLEDYLTLAIQKWYCPKIHNRNLKNFCKKKWLSVSVNNNPIRKTDMIPFFHLVQELYTTAIAKTYSSEYVSEQYPGISSYPVNIRGYLDGSTSGYVSVIKIIKDDLGGPMTLSPYDYIGKFEADGGLNEPVVMYTRDPGMVIEYAVTGAWVKNISPPENDNEFLFAFYMPDTKKKIKNDLSVPEYAGETLGEYLRACEASDHMSWVDPAKMQIVDRIQKNTVNRIIEQQTVDKKSQIEATASKLSGKLGRMLLPRAGYASGNRGNGSDGGPGGGMKLKDVSFEILSKSFSESNLILDFSLKLSHAKKDVDVSVIVDSEGGRIDPAAWQKDIGTLFPATIADLTIHSAGSKTTESFVIADAVCTPDNPAIVNEYLMIELGHAVDSSQYTSFKVKSNILNIELNGTLTIHARDKKYNFSFRVI